MSKRHYRIIILGDSLASRIAAVLMAKQGMRVLSCHAPGPPLSNWLFSSLHLEQILERLGGRSCFVPAVPFQVLTSTNRIEFNGSATLDEELRREFPQSFSAVQDFLHQLAQTGERLEKFLMAQSPFPLIGSAPRLRCILRGLRHGLSLGTLSRSLRDRLESISEPEARYFLETLFTGLAFAPAQDLTFGECSLLWASAVRGRHVSLSGLEALLHHRYEQFHGETLDLGQVKKIDSQGRKLSGLLLKNGTRCGGDSFLLGGREPLPHLPLDLPLPEQKAGSVYETTPLKGATSPLLASRIILGGDPPLRLAFRTRENKRICTVEVCPGSAPPSEDQIHRRLKEIIPFGDFKLHRLGDKRPAAISEQRKRLFFSGSRPLPLGGNLLLGDAASALPTLGMTGAPMVGFTCANYFNPPRRK